MRLGRWTGFASWVALAVVAVIAMVPGPVPAYAEGEVGDFDLYVLSLSWSPAYCASHHDDQTQCGLDKNFGLVVHGLWPQYTASRPGDDGKPVDWPANCAAPATTMAVNAAIPAAAAVWPSLNLYRHEWHTHGSCSGLVPADYVALTSQLRQRFEAPASLLPGDTDRRIDAVALRSSIISANPGLPPQGLSLFCRKNRLAEIRLCLQRDGDHAYTACPGTVLAEDSCSGKIVIQGLGG